VDIAEVMDPGSWKGGTGTLDPAVLWPLKRGGYDRATVTQRVKGYILEADAKVASLPVALRDSATKAWVEYRAYWGVYQTMVRQASSIDVTNEGAARWSDAQIEAMRLLAVDALARYEGIVATTTTVTDTYLVQRSYR
jgi:hypothetical protein